MDISNKRFTTKGLWVLFSVCAFPVHVWTFILFFRDFSWISERTNSWDAFGVGAYGLLIALFESILVFVISLILSIFIPINWNENKRVTVLGVLVLLTAIWTIIGQLYFLLDFNFPLSWIRAIARNPHPLWVLYGVVLVFVGPSVLIPAYGILKAGQLGTWIFKSFETVTILTALYLFLDIVGIIIVVIRNI